MAESKLSQTRSNIKRFIIDNKEALIIGFVAGLIIGLLLF